MVTTSTVATLETCIYAERHGRLFSLKLTYHGAPEDLIRQLEATLRAVEERDYIVRAFKESRPVAASQIVKYAAISALILGVLLVLALLLFLGGNQWN